MPPKSKPLQTTKSKAKGKTKAKVENPQIPEDFLEVADEHEQAGGKWRQGDAAKAARFFRRAIGCYDEGLQKFPNDFDLAFNKAHLQYEICEDDNILPEFGDLVHLLEETLESQRYALQLDPSNTDAQFNTGQTLALLAEAIVDADTVRDTQDAKKRASELLQEAVVLFEKCLESQQQQYEKNAAALAASGDQDEDQMDVDQTDGPAAPSAPSSISGESLLQEEWVSIEEPLTPITILDTCEAELEALETLFCLNDPQRGPLDRSTMGSLAAKGRVIMESVIPTLFTLLESSPFQEAEDEPTGPTLSISSPSKQNKAERTPKENAVFAMAKTAAAIFDYEYRDGRTTTSQYATNINEIFEELVERPESKHMLPAYLDAHVAYADALVKFASTVKDVSKDPRILTPPDPAMSTATDIQRAQWDALTKAQGFFKKYCAGEPGLPPKPSALRDIYLLRGDAELLRVRLSSLYNAEPSWFNNRETLIRNAGVYYRGAQKWAEVTEDEVTRDEAGAKNMIADVLRKILISEPIKSDEKQLWDSHVAHLAPMLKDLYDKGVLPRAIVNQAISVLSLDRQQILDEEEEIGS